MDFNDDDEAMRGGVSPIRNGESILMERKILDKVPRDKRLKIRKGSPWGLSLQELDDRGLIDGGFSVPNYYTSLRQRNRRALEMRQRSSRLKDRGKKNAPKIFENFYHMIRILNRRGFNIEDVFRQHDSNDQGFISKHIFQSILNSVGLPFRTRDIIEITEKYISSERNDVDYKLLLRDAGVVVDSTENDNVTTISAEDTTLASNLSNNVYLTIINNIKHFLQETMHQLTISFDEIYRMFAKWAVDGTHTITVTQFFRALKGLHVETISDQEQDYLIELLDTTQSGRIDFELFLTFCFADIIPELDSPYGTAMGLLYGETEDGRLRSSRSGGSSFKSGMSCAYSAGNRSPSYAGVSGVNRLSTKINRPIRRPQSATIDRPLMTMDTLNSFMDPQSATWVSQVSNSQTYYGSADDFSSVGASSSIGKLRRPVTAYARVPHTPSGGRSDISSDGSGQAINKRVTTKNKGGTGGASSVPLEEVDDIVVVDDDGEDDGTMDSFEQSYTNSVTMDAFGTLSNRLQTSPQYPSSTMYQNDNSVPELDHPSPTANTSHTTPLTGVDDETPSYIRILRSHFLSKQQAGMSLKDVYRSLDTRYTGTLDISDFLRVLSGLVSSNNLSNAITSDLTRVLAIDGTDTVSFGEFAAFVTDSQHMQLLDKVRDQVSLQVERRGQVYVDMLFQAFTRDGAKPEYVSNVIFVSGLRKIGICLPTSDINRLIVHFDTHGDGNISVSRFIRMVRHTTDFWDRCMLSYYCARAADEEAKEAHRMLLSHSHPTDVSNKSMLEPSESVISSACPGKSAAAGGSVANDLSGLYDELVDMAAYLGIGVFTETHMLWIAAEAVKSTLPDGWVLQTDRRGRRFYFNPSTDSSRQSHPLDSHFRRLRDSNRRLTLASFGPSATDTRASEQRPVDKSSDRERPKTASVSSRKPAMDTTVPSLTQPKSATNTSPNRPASADRARPFPAPKRQCSDSKLPSTGHSQEQEPLSKNDDDRRSLTPSFLTKRSGGTGYAAQAGSDDLGCSGMKGRERLTREAILQQLTPYNPSPEFIQQLESGNRRPRTGVVDRVLAVGRPVVSDRAGKAVRPMSGGAYRKDSHKKDKLAKMFNDDVLQRLDSILLTNRLSDASKRGKGSDDKLTRSRPKSATVVLL